MGRFLRFCIPRGDSRPASFSPAFVDGQPQRATWSFPRSSRFPTEAPKAAGTSGDTDTVEQWSCTADTALPACLSHSIVEYSSPDEAQKAISSLTNKTLEGRQVFVREVSAAVVALVWGPSTDQHLCSPPSLLSAYIVAIAGPRGPSALRHQPKHASRRRTPRRLWRCGSTRRLRASRSRRSLWRASSSPLRRRLRRRCTHPAVHWQRKFSFRRAAVVELCTNMGLLRSSCRTRRAGRTSRISSARRAT
jgi:hypothetical protein